MCRAYALFITHAADIHVALTVVLLKSSESQKIESSQRFIYHGSGAQLICAGVDAVGTAYWCAKRSGDCAERDSRETQANCVLVVEALELYTGRTLDLCG